jgi:hypothetical protein
MGGLGSTRWEWHRKTRAVEDCVCISTVRPRDQLTRHIGVLRPDEFSAWVTRCNLDGARNGLFEILETAREQPILRVSLSPVGGGMADGQSHTMAFAGMNPHLGGTRWWYVCPLCNRRMSALYLPPNTSHFGCRLCHGLTYKSSQQSHVVPALVSVDAAICRLRRQVDDLMRGSST